MKTKKNEGQTPISELFELEKIDLGEISDRLWFEYFSPLKAHDKPMKKFIMEQYNVVADIMNKRAEKIIMVKITPSMLWDNAKKENPTSTKIIYCEVKVFDETDQPKTKTKTKIVKVPDQKEIPKALSEEKDLSKYGKNKKEIIWTLHAAGKTKDEIVQITGYTRKVCTDMIWHYTQAQSKKK